MITLNDKLARLQSKLDAGDHLTIAILGLGSVGCYLLDYLLSLGDPQLRIAVVGRNREKMVKDVNIIRTAACIRRKLVSEVSIVSDCDFTDVQSVAKALDAARPDILVNSSRYCPGVKYGSVSWANLRAYGIWAPLAVVLGKTIMEACELTECNAITINTSYSDAVIPWLKSAGKPYFDFGSGNLNHLIPRIKFYISEKFRISDLNDIDVTLVTSHFHDVVISKEGHTEGVEPLLSVKYKGNELPVDKADLYKACAIPMPTDQKRNMMNASSNLDIICSVLEALRKKTQVKIHVPGVGGFIGGYPFIIDGTGEHPSGYFASVFPLEQMISANRASIYLDGIADVCEGNLIYTDKLLHKVENRFGIHLPKKVSLNESREVADMLLEQIVFPNTQVGK